MADKSSAAPLPSSGTEAQNDARPLLRSIWNRTALTVCAMVGGFSAMMTAPLWLYGGPWYILGVAVAIGVLEMVIVLWVRSSYRKSLLHAPTSFRILPDRVVGRFPTTPDGPSPAGEKVLPFREHTLFRAPTSAMTIPGITNMPLIGEGLGEGLSLDGLPLTNLMTLTPDNVRVVQEAWGRWKASGTRKALDQPVKARTPKLTGAPLRWYENRIVGKPVNRGPKRVGVDDEGVHIPRTFGKARVIPWGELMGPTHQMFGTLWNIYDTRRARSLWTLEYFELGTDVAKVLAADPRCPRRSMARSDLVTLGLQEEQDVRSG